MKHFNKFPFYENRKTIGSHDLSVNPGLLKLKLNLHQSKTQRDTDIKGSTSFEFLKYSQRMHLQQNTSRQVSAYTDNSDLFGLK